MSKRKRDPTFAASEKMALIDLVEKHFHILESKKTDAVNMTIKTEKWRLLADEFNAMSSIYPRDWSVLKSCWENLKKRAKQEQTLRNQHFLGTGGGPPKKLNEDPATERVLELIRTRVCGFVNNFDSDGTLVLGSGINQAQTQEPTPMENLLVISEIGADNDTQLDLTQQQQEVVVSTESADTVTIDWSQYTPSMLRGNKNLALGRSSRPSPAVQGERDSVEQEGSPITATASTSRRRPTMRRESERSNLNSERINTLLKVNSHAEEEHAIQMDILRIQEQREKEILEQEKLKTKQEKVKLQILEMELKKIMD